LVIPVEPVFDICLENCPQCGGEFKIIAAIEESLRCCQDPHASGHGLARAAALTGAAAVSLPGSLILEVATFCNGRDDLARPAIVQSGQNCVGISARVDEEFENSL
jgi:hypothetical protein